MLIHATVDGTRYAVDAGPAESLLTDASGSISG